jgi:PPM family protein phosphatase
MTTLSAVPDDGSARFERQSSHLRLDVEFAARFIPERGEGSLGHVAPSSPARARSHGWFFALAQGAHSPALVEHLTSGFRRAAPSEGLSALLMRLVQEAAALDVPPRTTLAACALRYDRVVVTHVGDARCYLIRQRQARLLTHDPAATRDSLAGIETSDIQVYPGDILALASAGMNNSLAPADVAGAASGADLDSAAEQLLRLAIERDHQASVGLQLIRVRSVERLAIYRRKAFHLR